MEPKLTNAKLFIGDSSTPIPLSNVQIQCACEKCVAKRLQDHILRFTFKNLAEKIGKQFRTANPEATHDALVYHINDRISAIGNGLANNFHRN